MLSQTANISGMTSNFLFNIQSGYLKGFEAYRAYGLNNDCDLNTDNYLWEGKVKYIYPTTNEKMYINSTLESDISTAIIFGLYEEIDGTWVEKRISVTLNGTTLVSTSELEFIRIFDIRYNTSDGTNNIGIISLYNSNTILDETTLKAQILEGTNRTNMAQFTVPTGKIGFIYRLYRSVRKNQDADFIYEVRPFGAGFRSLGSASSFQSSGQEAVSYEPLHEKTDLQIKVMTENNNTQARGSYHLILVDKENLELTRMENFVV